MNDTSPVSIDYAMLRHLLPARPREAHKGHFGHVLVVGGDAGMGGAALMSVATHPTHASSFLARRPELMVRGIDNSEDLPPLLDQASVIVLGPGLGQSDWSRLNLRMTLRARARRQGLPLVVDADGLNLISQGLNAGLDGPVPDWILTPHPGEAARLLGIGTGAIQDDRAAAARWLQARYGGVAVLKGAGSLICYARDARQHLDRCSQGNPGMASGGMGDVLSGILGGLLAQGHAPADAARLGVCLHAASADRAAAVAGERGLLATDLLPWVHRLVNPAQ